MPSASVMVTMKSSIRDEAAFDLLAGGGRDGGRGRRNVHRRRLPAAEASAAAGHQPGLLKHSRIGELRAEALEVAGDGMAAGAFRFEVGLAGVRIADHDIGGPVARGVVAAHAEAVNERGDVGELRRGQVELGHARAALRRDLSNELTVLILEDDFRANQAGSAFAAAASVLPVAKGALRAVKRLAALDRGRVCRRALRIGVSETSAASAARCRPASAASASLHGRLRGRSLGENGGGSDRRDENVPKVQSSPLSEVTTIVGRVVGTVLPNRVLRIDGENEGDVTGGAMETEFYRQFHCPREW